MFSTIPPSESQRFPLRDIYFKKRITVINSVLIWSLYVGIVVYMYVHTFIYCNDACKREFSSSRIGCDLIIFMDNWRRLKFGLKTQAYSDGTASIIENLDFKLEK